MKREFCASAFVINPLNKKILLVKHHIFNKWVQPGGHIEKGELPEEAAIREVYEETGVKIRFLVGIRRIPLTIIKDQKTSNTYLRENVNVLRAVAKSPYVVGSDFIGEEINDISDLQPAIDEIVKYINEEDKDFTIRIHAGENDSLRDNVRKSIMCIKEALQEGQKMPRCRLGHGLYSDDLRSKAGHELMELMEENGVVIEFQLTSNVRLNNLSDLSNHPLKTFLKNFFDDYKFPQTISL